MLKIALVLFLAVLPAAPVSPADSLATSQQHYHVGTASRDGIGKFYHGREIAQVMGHRGARWLERNSRVFEELPDLAVEAMNLSADAVVADIGAGTGYFTFRLAAQVPSGRVYAVDIQTEMLDIIRKRMQRREVDNIVPVLGEPHDPALPVGEVDAVLLVDAYHEFDHPHEMMQAIVRSLQPEGRVYLVEYRGEDRRIPVKPLHKMTEQQAIKEMRAVGLEWVDTLEFLPTQHFMIFKKTG